MSNETSTLEVFILDKSYRVSSPESEQDSLRASATYLDRKMREIRGGGKIIGLERIAVIAALNITHELLSTSRQVKSGSDSKAERARLIARVEKTLDSLQADA